MKIQIIIGPRNTNKEWSSDKKVKTLNASTKSCGVLIVTKSLSSGGAGPRSNKRHKVHFTKCLEV